MKRNVSYTSIAKAIMAMALAGSPYIGTYAQASHTMPQGAKVRHNASASGVNLYAFLNQSDEHSKGLYSFNTSSPTSLKLVKNGIDCYAGATYAQGTLWTTYYEEDETSSQILFPIKLYSYDTETWQQTEERRGLTFTSIASDLTFDPVTQALYGIFSDASYSGSYRTLGRMKYTTTADYPYTIFDSDPIIELPQKTVAIACSRDGQLYVIDKNGLFSVIDKYTGEVTASFSTGQKVVPFFQSATCDFATGKVYWAAYDEEDWATRIIEIDPSAKTAKKIADFGSDGTGAYDYFTTLYIKQDLDLATLPNAVSGLAVSMTSLMGGDVTFAMPTADVKGNNLNEKLNYSVRADGKLLASGSAMPGANVKTAITTDKSGNSLISVTAERPATSSQPAAESEPQGITTWVGYDVPEAPSKVRLSASGSKVTLSWTAPTQGVNGGYFDKDNLKYTIYRYSVGNENDSVNVADNLSATSYVDNITATDINTYYYKIAAVNGDMRSQMVQTREVNVGTTLSLPYSNSLDDVDKLDNFTVDDANNDGSTWDFDTYYSMAAYSANADNNADDWLITPPIKMQKGAAYKFAFDAVNDYPTERVAAAVGKAPEGKSLTSVVIAPTDVTYTPRRRTLSGTYRASEDGLQYFGIHAISDANCNHLYVDNLKITEIASTAPDAPTEISVIPGENGASNAHISFKAPTKTLGGNSLTGKLMINVYRNGESIKTLTSVAPGEACSYDDQNVPSGSCIYSVVAVNSQQEEGLEATQKVFVGIDVPGPVQNLKAYEDADKEGLIHIVWDAPKGLNGGYINDDDLTYYISVGTASEDINLGNKRSYDDQLTISNGKQSYNGYSVYAVNSTGGSSSNQKICLAIGGPALTTPMIESFKGVTMKSGPWITEVTKGEVGEAYCYCMTASNTATAADDDGGMQSFSATETGKAVRSESPKVDISKANNPVLNFWAYCNGKGDKLTVSIQKNYGEFTTAMTILSDQYEEGWHRFSIDLKPYKDSKYIRVGFEGEAVNTTEEFMAYDNVAIVDDVAHDLMVTSISTDEEKETGEQADIKLCVRNNSSTDTYIEDYSVVLFKNGKEMARFNGPDIKADYEATINMSDRLTAIDDDTVEYYAKVDYPADVVDENNTSSTVSVKVKKSDYPAPSALSAASRTSSVALQWEAPDLVNRKPKATTDSFEDYKAFAISDYGDWTTYDCDQQNTIRITLNEAFGPLNYENAGEPMAFQVFNAGEAGIPFAAWDAHTGEQMLACFACASADGGFSKKQNDDWLISPELNGETQTLSFYAKVGMSAATPESMEVLYSTTDKSMNSFTKIGEIIDVLNYKNWEEYKVDLPMGAKYFAIRCISHDKFALLIDDISYIAKDAVPEELELLGYNIYRDGKKVNTKPVNRCWYNDEGVSEKQQYSYLVTAAYDNGESRPSNMASITFESGINDAAAGSVATVKGGHGSISINGAEGKMIKIYTADGGLIVAHIATGTEQVSLTQGMYLVTVNGAPFKVAVK